MSSIKREIRQFCVVVVQRRQRNVQKKVIHVQRFFLPIYTYFFFPVLVAVAVVVLKLPIFSSNWSPQVWEKLGSGWAGPPCTQRSESANEDKDTHAPFLKQIFVHVLKAQKVSE